MVSRLVSFLPRPPLTLLRGEGPEHASLKIGFPFSGRVAIITVSLVPPITEILIHSASEFC